MNPDQLFAHLQITNPWRSLKKKDRLPFDDHGWFSDRSKESLAALLKRLRPAVVLELGSWLGASTRFLASYAPLVIAVDHWQGSPEHQGREDVADKLPTLYEQFLSNCWQQNNVIAPLRMTTQEAMGLPLPTPGLIYVDASHDKESVLNDLKAAWALLGKRGILCGDDWKWKDDEGNLTVREAVEEFAAARSKKIKTSGSFWQLSPKTSGEAYQIATHSPAQQPQSIVGLSMPMGGTTPEQLKERRKKGGRTMTAREMVESQMGGTAPAARSKPVKVTGNPVMSQSPMPKGVTLKGMHESTQGAPKTHVTLEQRKPANMPKGQGSDKLPQAKILKMGQRTQVARPQNVKVQPQDNVIRKNPGEN